MRKLLASIFVFTLTTFAAFGQVDRTLSNEIRVEKVNNDGTLNEHKFKSSDFLPSENGDRTVTISDGEIVHLILKGPKKFDALIIENKTGYVGEADFIAFDEAGEVIENGSDEFGPAAYTAVWYDHLQNLSRSSEIHEIYVRISLKDVESYLDLPTIAERSEELFAVSALTTTFARPVTRDTGGYRKYDSTAVRGKFHTGDDYYNSDLKVLASNCGVVVARYTTGNGDRGLGNTIIVKHAMTDGGTSYSLYGHLASFASNTEVGKAVSRGQRIGTMGKSGSGSNNIVHLHYEIKRSGILGNPRAFGTYSVNALGLVGYVPQWAGNKYASSASDFGYFKPSVGDYPAICSQ